ncbi:unnamed protein product [Hyaloperonospora brassicae]|uniref:PHD-type domain-containing protein n=1 Tax=Hyaloperonospora brassicae TaxID=162125 RepID=A0AAV0SXQ2_HYABA|nr:unnamed protein product [Hyaloperonospora brassicae]
MYHGTPQDHGDKKRQRLTNELWMEAIMNKSKTPEGFMSASTTTSSGVTTPSTSSAVNGEERVVAAPSWEAPTSQMSMAQQQFATGYQERPTERSNRYQGRTPEIFSQSVQDIPMETAYQTRIVSTPVAPGYAARTNVDAGYHGKPIDTSITFPRRLVQPATTNYQGETTMDGGTVYQRRTADEAVVQYQDRMGGRAASEYVGKPANEPAGHQGRASDVSVAYKPEKVSQDLTGYQSKTLETSTGMLHQEKRTEARLGKLAEGYKKDRKLPPRVEEMLREQMNLDESVLHDAFAVAMDDLILEQEANFVAKGVCHLCVSKVYLPVVNFCPHADENHSLCREHLRSVYRVRMEALFVGKNRSAPNRRLLRCLVCTRGCPCTQCTAEKEKDVQNYKRYLLDTLRRCGHGPESAVKDRQASAASASPALTGRLAFGQSVSNNDGRQYAQYAPTPLPKDCFSVQGNGLPARGSLMETANEACKLTETHRSDLNRCQERERCDREGYVSNAQLSSMPTSSIYASSMQLSSLQTSGLSASSTRISSLQVSSIHAPQSDSTQQVSMSKRAASSLPSDVLSMTADGEQSTDRRTAARAAPSRIHRGSMESPSAATVLNCAESEKSLVQLLSSLNQGRAPANSAAVDVSSKDSAYSRNVLHYDTNEKAADDEAVGDASGEGSKKTEASLRVDSACGISDNRHQSEHSYHDEPSTSSMATVKSSSRDRVKNDGRSIEASKLRKRKSDETDRANGAGPHGQSNVASRDSTRVAYRDDSSAPGQQHSAGERQHKTGTRPSLRLDGCEKDSTSKADSNKKHSSQKSPPPPHRRPGRPRKALTDANAAAQTERRGQQNRKTTTSIKRGRGRPPKRGKRAKSDEDMEDENGNEEHEEEEKDEDGADSELDANLDYCEVCEGAGDLVCCDKCPRSFHLKCLDMTETDLPEGDWQCSECKKPSRFDAYSVMVASERTVLDKCLKIVQCLKSHPFSKQFLSPVENVPMYTRVVKQPMDLSKIESKLKKGAYIVDSNTVADGVEELDATHFANDIRLMWSNCKTFNDDGSGITRAADILSAGFERLYKECVAPPLTAQDGC